MFRDDGHLPVENIEAKKQREKIYQKAVEEGKRNPSSTHLTPIDDKLRRARQMSDKKSCAGILGKQEEITNSKESMFDKFKFGNAPYECSPIVEHDIQKLCDRLRECADKGAIIGLHKEEVQVIIDYLQSAGYVK